MVIDPKKVREMRATGMPIRDIAEELGTKRRYIEEILHLQPTKAKEAAKPEKLGEEKPLETQPVKTGKKRAKAKKK